MAITVFGYHKCKELNAEVINAGRINSKHLKVGSDTEFEDGYDTRALFEVTNDRITATVESINGEIASLTIESNQIKTSVVDLENNLSSKSLKLLAVFGVRLKRRLQPLMGA